MICCFEVLGFEGLGCKVQAGVDMRCSLGRDGNAKRRGQA